MNITIVIRKTIPSSIIIKGIIHTDLITGDQSLSWYQFSITLEFVLTSVKSVQGPDIFSPSS